jgi:hypothetical protein
MLLAHGEKGEKINRFSRELTSLEKGGEPAQLVEEFQQNHFLKLQISQKNPSVSLRLPAPFSREPNL